MSTLNELIAQYNSIATTVGKPTRKSFDNKAKAEAAIAELQKASMVTLKVPKATKPKLSGAAIKVRKSTSGGRIVNGLIVAGPRGFQFGPVWLNSIRQSKSPATKPANMPKLKATAAHLGLTLADSLSQEELIAAIAKKL